ncbi:MAG: ribose-phosphate diphosphokinase, partial [Lentisphaeria bacterium]
YAAPVFVRHLRTVLGPQAVVVAPDTGSVKMAQSYADMLGLGFAVVAKRRISAEQVAASHLVGDVAGRDCVLVDDLTTTGSTLIEAARILLEAGAKRVFAAISHYAVTRSGHDRLSASGLAGVITTDSVPMPADWQPGKVQVLSIAELLATAVQRVHESQSVSSLFRT